MTHAYARSRGFSRPEKIRVQRWQAACVTCDTVGAPDEYLRVVFVNGRRCGGCARTFTCQRCIDAAVALDPNFTEALCVRCNQLVDEVLLFGQSVEAMAGKRA